MKRIFAGVIAFIVTIVFVPLGTSGQQSTSPSTLPPPATVQKAEFMQAADEVLAEMSKLISLPILTPLKKSMRSREEIRAYLLQKLDEDKDKDKRYADQKTMEKFGLLPRDYPLEETLVKVLTEQIAGLYDSDSQEFFIADWTSPADERMVMSHELTHALQDQHFHIDKWTRAAKPNDDAELARDAVLEGSAMVAMLDYQLRGKGSVRDLGDFDPTLLMGDADSSPELADAPKVLQDELMFPYIAGTKFTQKVLQATSGWPDFSRVFARPPVSTQQIMHPDMYLKGVVPPKITLPDTSGVISANWKKLDENNMGEFGLQEIFKQFLTKDRATSLAAAWSADRYALFEDQKSKQTLLVFDIRLASDADAALFFGAYSEVLELKYDKRTNLMRRPNFFSFDTSDNGVFLRCLGTDCFILEGGTRPMFDRLTSKLSWPAGPIAPIKPGESRIKVAERSAFPVVVANSHQPMSPMAQ